MAAVMNMDRLVIWGKFLYEGWVLGDNGFQELNDLHADGMGEFNLQFGVITGGGTLADDAEIGGDDGALSVLFGVDVYFQAGHSLT